LGEKTNPPSEQGKKKELPPHKIKGPRRGGFQPTERTALLRRNFNPWRARAGGGGKAGDGKEGGKTPRRAKCVARRKSAFKIRCRCPQRRRGGQLFWGESKKDQGPPAFKSPANCEVRKGGKLFSLQTPGEERMCWKRGRTDVVGGSSQAAPRKKEKNSHQTRGLPRELLHY